MTLPLRLSRDTVITILTVLKAVLIGIILVLVIQIQVNTAKQAASTAQTARQIKTLSEDNKRLAQQNKQLAEQNAQLSKQNQQYLGCNFLAFAHFTQTLKPIQDSEINSCNIAPVAQGSYGAPSQSSVKQKSATATTQPSKAAQTSSSAPTQPTTQPANMAPAPAEPSKPSLLNRAVQNVVGIPGKIIKGMSGLL